MPTHPKSIKLSKRVSDSYNHAEGVAAAFMTLDASNVERRRQGREAKGDQRGTNHGAAETAAGSPGAPQRQLGVKCLPPPGAPAPLF
jgi:hypothetical protein